MKSLACLLLCLIALSSALPPAARAETVVDLELVLAVDGSGSVDTAEFALQMRGIAEALRDPEVAAAIMSGPLGRIAISLVIWSEANRPKQVLPWRILEDPLGAAAFAGEVESTQRAIPAGGTGIGKALQFAVWHLNRNGIAAARRVIDLSGDGEESAFRDWSLDVRQGRYLAEASGIQINGLAILTDEPDLERYYRENVVTGPGAFVIAASDYRDFAHAMRRKLFREIEDTPLLGQAPTTGDRSALQEAGFRARKLTTVTGR